MSEPGPLAWKICTCSGGDDITQVDIHGNGVAVGLVGLKQALQHLRSLGVEPAESAAEQLLTIIQGQNYVPHSAQGAYKAALLREYTAYCAKGQQSD
jgi:hypothetical protein